MTFDAEAYAEGICNSAAGSSIEVFVDMLDAIIDPSGDGSIITDAIDYRRGEIPSDTEDPDEQEDLEQAEGYLRINEQLKALREAIVRREKESGEDTSFGDDDEEDNDGD